MSNWTFKENSEKVFSWSKTSEGQERSPYKFKARLRYNKYSRGRSSVTFWMEDVDSGKQYPMFISDFDELLKDQSFIKGELSVPLWFIHCKKGQNIGIKLYHGN